MNNIIYLQLSFNGFHGRHDVIITENGIDITSRNRLSPNEMAYITNLAMHTKDWFLSRQEGPGQTMEPTH